jgi:hypothetical protein
MLTISLLAGASVKRRAVDQIPGFGEDCFMKKSANGSVFSPGACHAE